MTSLPLLGAAMPLDTLESLRDWVLADQRDLELQDFTTAEVLCGDWQPLAARARALLDGYEGRLGIHGPFWGLSLANLDFEIRAIVTKRLLQGLEVCEALGATQMVIHSPYTTWDYNNLDNYAEARDRVVALVHETLAPAVARAEDLGVTLVIENIEDKDTDARCLLADSFASDAVAVSVDTGHAHYAHGTHGAAPVDYYIRRAGERLRHVHLQDADGYADRHWGIGLGTINWASVFDAVAPLDGRARLILELRDKAQILPSAQRLAAMGLAR
ncbi:sugar phosphate isomerase/epimerase family protein [uncultured Salipiger sp.]|uniref:sugar phosphate isomerase/epimerase family protein n=1 Tax=uncultured Salipiger sp. TaxID=499810 RepID=UPI00259477DA|nr:sugar phosphate isomerase/epimerase family protein [uncultured Salipiger sp.]